MRRGGPDDACLGERSTRAGLLMKVAMSGTANENLLMACNNSTRT